MPIITIGKISDQTKTSAKGKKYKVVHVEGTKYGSEEPWDTNIFQNDTVVLDMLNEFGPGEMANFKFKKNGNFWDLKEIVQPTAENLEYASNPPQVEPGAKKTTGGKSKGTSSGGMSKEEWAAKDKATKESIARAVSVKLANDNTKIGTKPEAVIKMAVEFLPFLLGEDEILFDSPFKEPESVLDPPVED